MDWYCQKATALLGPSGNLSRHMDWYCQKATALLSPSGILTRRQFSEFTLSKGDFIALHKAKHCPPSH